MKLENTKTEGSVRPLHIVHIIPSLRYGGAERMVVNLINHSDQRGFHYSIITFSNDMPLHNQIVVKNVDVHVVPKHGKISLHLFSDLERVLRQLQPDIVHTHLSGGDIWGRVAAKRLSIPTLSTQHNVARDLGCVKNFVLRRFLACADQYVACSSAITSSVVRAQHISPEHINIIPNGVILNTFSAIPSIPWRTPVQLLMIGRLTRQKGHDIALHALAAIKSVSWHLTIMGEGEWGPMLASLAGKLGIAERVTFAQPTTDVAFVFKQSDIVLMPSRYEGLGVVAMEAMAAGKLVIASGTDGLQEIVEHQKTGLLVEKENPAALANMILWAVKHERECETIAHNARGYANEHFGIEKMVDGYEKLYEKVIGDR